MSKSWVGIFVWILLASAGASASTEVVETPSHSVESASEIFTMDQLYKSMFGPADNDLVSFSEPRRQRPEVIWITGIRADIVGADGGTAESQEYFCHSNLILVKNQPMDRLRLFGKNFRQKRKLFTLIQGQTEIAFPRGFGMPVLSNDQFNSHVMVMNPTVPEEPVRVGVSSRIEYVRDSELEREIRPLFNVALVTKVPIETPETALLSAGHGGEESCLDGDAHAPVVESVDRSVVGRRSPLSETTEGTEATGHWYVPPGRHVYRRPLEDTAKVFRFDTRAHYIAAHLHPYGESLELIDVTAGESVFKATARNHSDRVAIEEITHYSGEDGIPIYVDHQYEIEAIYDNTTNEDIDSMAVMYLYLHDKEFRNGAGVSRPRASQPSAYQQQSSR